MNCFGRNNYVCQISLQHVVQKIIQSKIHFTMILKKVLFGSYHNVMYTIDEHAHYLMFWNLLSMISASKEIGRRLEICSKNSSLDSRFTSCFMISDKVGLQIVIFWFVFSQVLYSSWTLQDFFSCSSSLPHVGHFLFTNFLS